MKILYLVVSLFVFVMFIYWRWIPYYYKNGKDIPNWLIQIYKFSLYPLSYITMFFFSMPGWFFTSIIVSIILSIVHIFYGIKY